MLRTPFAILLISLLPLQSDPGPQGWEIFSEITLYWKHFEEIGQELATPKFDEKLLQKQGEEIVLSGYYMPMDLDSSFIISALPYSSCFFCGGGGPETVAQIMIYPVPQGYGPDDMVKVKGKLKLNDTDLSKMSIYLESAEVIRD